MGMRRKGGHGPLALLVCFPRVPSVKQSPCGALAPATQDRVRGSLSLSLTQLEEMANFNFAVWRKRYLQWISHRKSRLLDVFRSIDRDQDGRITQQEFVEHVLASSECQSRVAFPWVSSMGIGQKV